MKTPSEQRTNEVLADLLEKMHQEYEFKWSPLSGKTILETRRDARVEAIADFFEPVLGFHPFSFGYESTRMAVYDILRQLRDPNHRGTIKTPQIGREGPFS